jgi:hypothetical protein
MTHPHRVIHVAALRYIRAHAMDAGQWKWTRLDEIPAVLHGHVTLVAEELPIVSCYLSEVSWYLMTTFRVIGAHRQNHFDFNPLSVAHWKWGDFKGIDKSETGVLRADLGAAGICEVAYETGKASMAPIHYERFWQIKYPIVHKLAV